MAIQVYNDHLEVSDKDFDKLRDLVTEAKSLSYCPYSKFRVASCVLTESGDFITGVNVENASYGAGICAERAAISRAVSQGHRKFRAIAIAADTPKPIVPCGICRQFMREFNEDIVLFLFSKESDHIKVYLKDLLPLSFGPEDLGIEIK
ncbi:Cdd1 protein [Candida orthopsilosis Co 90-125]|uniref:Cytidine deaminase n=1 Tax=Candida orthopsilosis (strain 90-125) TaxID=1136231 RepID=H8X776_CANO9|nr:Cdd1 protein [Candida orthopsilosis Co 90-125]CCG24004.1 Cdd1 protein [Candida orthopsilosis Co 90-125]